MLEADFVSSLPPERFSRFLPLMMVYGADRLSFQIRMDSRWPRVAASYERLGRGDLSERRLSVAEHKAAFRAAGFDLEVAAAAGRYADEEEVVEWSALVARSSWGLDGAFDERAAGPAPPRKCSACKAETECECVCGRAFCSRACQRAGRAGHAEECATVVEGQLIQTLLTSEWWSRQGVSVEVRSP